MDKSPDDLTLVDYFLERGIDISIRDDVSFNNFGQWKYMGSTDRPTSNLYQLRDIRELY